MIEAVIFDMDGLLIDSEPFWLEAQRKIFPLAGIQITDDMWKETLGIRNKEVVEMLYAKYPWDLNRISQEELDDKIVEYVIDLIYRKGKAMEGVGEILSFFRKQKVKIALASSSDFRMIDAVIDKLNLQDYFEVVHSAEAEQYGKPHPAVFISTARKLRAVPSHCLAIEDSINGLLSAKSARMKCAMIPGESLKNDRRLGMADAVLTSLRDFDDAVWSQFN
jgi:sugar-phosphatase